MNLKKENKKHSVWLSKSAWTEVESRYQQDNCSTRNEFIEKAIRFYSGYLDTESADAYLPRVLADVLEGKLGAFGKRMGHLLFKQAVELDQGVSVLADCVHLDEEYLRKKHAESVARVKKLNGHLQLEQMAKRAQEQRDSDDGWQD